MKYSHSLSICTAMIWIALAALSCGSTEKTPAETNAANSSDGKAVTEETQKIPVFTSFDRNGGEFTILSKMEGSSTGRWTAEDFAISEPDGDVVNDAIYERNQKLEELFNCNIVNVQENMGGLFSYTMYQTISKLIQSGDTYYDFIMPTIQDCAKLSRDGMLWDLTYYSDALHLDQPWWNQVFEEATCIGDKVFYANGDISLTFMRAAYAIMFNKQSIQDYELDNPYTLVIDGVWTIDHLMEMSRAASEDINGNGYMDSNDKIGLLMLYNSGEAFYAASGVKLVTAQDDGTLVWTGGSEKSIAVMNKIFDIYAETSATLNCDDASKMNDIYKQYTNVDRGANLFSAGQGLFLFGTMNNVPLMRDMDTDFGILPLPKADDTQDDYYSYVHTWSASAAAIPISAQKPEETAAFMETAAYYAQQIITPAYYTTALKTKYARDEESSAMLDLIYKKRWCDLGNIYNVGSVLTEMTTLITSKKQNTFASMIAKKESKIKTELQEINDAFLNQDS